MTTVKFDGAIQFQAVTGETVTVTVTRPDNTTETVTTQTLADKTWAVTKDYIVAGNYKAKAHINADGTYDAWDSVEKTFTIALTTRTGTFNVTLL